MDGGPCCGSASVCIFAKALQARAAVCELSERRWIGEREVIECPSPVARTNCGTLAALMHERARFALRLPRPGELLMHTQAMRLQCGGIAGLQQALQVPVADVHRLVGAAQERHGSLTALPWDDMVAAMRDWAPRRRHRPLPP
jgi:hypothetical protein